MVLLTPRLDLFAYSEVGIACFHEAHHPLFGIYFDPQMYEAYIKQLDKFNSIASTSPPP